MTDVDYGIAVHYTTVAKGTPVYDKDETQVGKILEVLDNHRENILDGFVFEDSDGTTRFVDAPEVARTFERGVMLTIDSQAVSQLGPPEKVGVGDVVKNSKLGRMFGR